jgi:hypothetical protein
MAVRRPVRRWAIAVSVAVGLVAVGSCSAAEAPATACLVVDTDVGLDDIRAFAVLMAGREISAVVVTEGISSVLGGASAISMFLGAGGHAPPVIPGRSSPAPPDDPFVAKARPIGERINGFLGASIPFGGDPDSMLESLDGAIAECDTIDVLLLGPWTSFVEYMPLLSDRQGDVVVSGRPISENMTRNFNCAYDLTACEAASASAFGRDATWVDLPPLPAVGEHTFEPTVPMVAALDDAGLTGVLRAALMGDQAAWASGSRLWDDATALYLFHPESFGSAGHHVEPAVDENTLRDLLVEAINA